MTDLEPVVVVECVRDGPVAVPLEVPETLVVAVNVIVDVTQFVMLCDALAELVLI